MKKYFKRSMLLIFLLAMMTQFSYAINFVDVPANSWYVEPVAWAIEQNITSGTSATTFSPDATCSKAQILTFLWRACGSPEPEMFNPFLDVSDTDYFCKPAIWAFENSMVEGEYFQPHVPCSRSMAVTYLWKQAGWPIGSATTNFTDVPTSADYVQAVSWALDMGITSGTSASTFSPDSTCTRSQIITFLYRSLAGHSESNSNSDSLVIG